MKSNQHIHEEVDNALIYTSDQWVCAYGLTDEEDAIEEGVCEPKNFGEALAAQAYCNLRSAVCAHSDEFEEAMQVAEDAAEEARRAYGSETQNESSVPHGHG